MATSTNWQLANEAAVRYEQILVPSILGPAAVRLVDAVNLQIGEHVLDIGCGTGAAARLAAEKVSPSGSVIAVDINPGMLQVAKSLPTNGGAPIDWQEKNAAELNLDHHSIDVALCAQTLQFLSEKRTALQEMYRVLKPGGRAGVSLWCEIKQNPYFYVLVDVISEILGQEVAAGLLSAFSLFDQDLVQDMLLESGFQKIIIEIAQLDLRLPRLAEFVPRHIGATPMAVGFNSASPGLQQAIVDEVIRRLAHYKTEMGYQIPFKTLVVRADK